MFNLDFVQIISPINPIKIWSSLHLKLRIIISNLSYYSLLNSNFINGRNPWPVSRIIYAAFQVIKFGHFQSTIASWTRHSMVFTEVYKPQYWPQITRYVNCFFGKFIISKTYKFRQHNIDLLAEQCTDVTWENTFN